MKKNNIIIAAASFILGSATIVGANQAIQAMQNTEIKVSLNGQVQTFKDETTGEVQYPITYHDRTYLPLRNVAQLAGVNVDYDHVSNTAILNSKMTIDDSPTLNNKKVFAIVNKYEWYSNQEEQAVYALLNDGTEFKLFNTYNSYGYGAYDLLDNTIYFLDKSNSKEVKLYSIDINDSLIPKEIYKFDSRAFLEIDYDNIEIYNNAMFYIRNFALYRLDLEKKENTFIDNIDNISFAVNNSNGKLYYTDNSYNLIEMDLNSNLKNVVVENASIDYVGKDGIIYTTVEPYDDPVGNGILYNHWKGYLEYSTLQKYKLYIDGTSSSGSLDNFEYKDGFIVINGDTISFIDKEGNILEFLEGKEPQKIKGTPTNLTLLPNNKILINSYTYTELHPDGANYYSYIIDLETKEVLTTDIESDYIYEKLF